MASRFVEADEEFIEETQVKTKPHKKVRTTGLKFSNIGQRREEKNEQLESYEIPEINEAFDNFALYYVKNKQLQVLYNTIQYNTIHYYMASSASGQYAAKLCSDLIAERARWSDTARPGLPGQSSSECTKVFSR